MRFHTVSSLPPHPDHHHHPTGGIQKSKKKIVNQIQLKKCYLFPDQTAAASGKGDEWKMLFTCKNKTTNQIVVMPKALLDQTVSEVDDCNVMKFELTDSWTLVKLPFIVDSKPLHQDKEAVVGTVFLDLPEKKMRFLYSIWRRFYHLSNI